MTTPPENSEWIDELLTGLIRNFSPDDSLIPLKEGESYIAYDFATAKAQIIAKLREARLEEAEKALANIKTGVDFSDYYFQQLERVKALNSPQGEGEK